MAEASERPGSGGDVHAGVQSRSKVLSGRQWAGILRAKHSRLLREQQKQHLPPVGDVLRQDPVLSRGPQVLRGEWSPRLLRLGPCMRERPVYVLAQVTPSCDKIGGIDRRGVGRSLSGYRFEPADGGVRIYTF